jgi:hypothetical protein
MKITGEKMPKLSTKEPAQWETTNNNNRKSLYKRLIEILHPNFDEIYTAK